MLYSVLSLCRMMMSKCLRCTHDGLCVLSTHKCTTGLAPQLQQNINQFSPWIWGLLPSPYSTAVWAYWCEYCLTKQKLLKTIWIYVYWLFVSIHDMNGRGEIWVITISRPYNILTTALSCSASMVKYWHTFQKILKSSMKHMYTD